MGRTHDGAGREAQVEWIRDDQGAATQAALHTCPYLLATHSSAALQGGDLDPNRVLQTQ